MATMLALEFERAVAPRQHHRDRDHPCEDTPEIPDDKVQSGPEQQERPITGSAALTQAPCHAGRTALQLAERQRRFFVSLVRQKHVGALVALLGCTLTEQIDK